MNINKHMEFFNPADVKEPIHIIGCGAVGSHVAEMLARLGFEKLNLWDMDTVEEHNITNQMFRFNDIGDKKTSALANICKEINPMIEIEEHDTGYNVEKDRPVSGYIFLCVDNIELRKEIVNKHMYSPQVKAMFDFRMRLTDAQHYAADWSDIEQKKRLLATMQFTKEEADAATPVSACGTTLSVAPTVKTLVSAGVANFINFCKDKRLFKMIILDPFNGIFDCF